MQFLERFLPSLRRSPAIAEVKKDLAKEKEANTRARNRVLSSVEALIQDFDVLRAEKREELLAAAGKRRKRRQ